MLVKIESGIAFKTCIKMTHNPDCRFYSLRFWKLDVDKVCGNGAATWDKAVHDASEEYKCRPVRSAFTLCVCVCACCDFVNIPDCFGKTIIFCVWFSAAQLVPGQLPLPRGVGSQPHALRQQHIMEHGQPLRGVFYSWEACDVRPSQALWFPTSWASLSGVSLSNPTDLYQGFNKTGEMVKWSPSFPPAC